MTVITTDRLTLPPVHVDDFEALAALWASEGITRYITGRPLTREEVWFRLLRDIGHWTSLGHGNWCLKTRDGTLVGSVGLFDYRRDLLPPFTDIEIGWALDERVHGLGLGTETVRAALAHADEKLNLSRLVCMISEANTPSIRLAEKSGFRFYGEGHYKGATVRLFERVRPAPATTG